MLELLAKLGRGDFLYTPTHAAFPRKLATLTKRLQRPIAHSLCVHTALPNSALSFHHTQETAPLLFADKPYTLYGTATKLEDLNLMIQGKGHHWINLAKPISLLTAERGKPHLDRELAARLALTHILTFLRTNDPQSLQNASSLLSPYDIPRVTLSQ